MSNSSSLDMRYHEDGYVVFPFYGDREVRRIDRILREWVYRLLGRWTHGREESFPLEKYHLWQSDLNINHDEIFAAPNRHMAADNAVRDLIVNENVRAVMSEIGHDAYDLWDGGLGWLAFRIVRPGKGDGYPMSRKEWGPAPRVVSFWVPVIGYSSQETLLIVPSSHLREYEKHMPRETKFSSDEYRVSRLSEDEIQYRPALKPGEAIMYHPRILHSEDVSSSSVTRFNLEFRLLADRKGDERKAT